MRAGYLNAPLLLLLWQVAPVDIKLDPGGRVRMGFSAGSGRYSFWENPATLGGFDCFGSHIPAKEASTRPATYTSLGLSAEVWARNTLRIRTAFGAVTDDSHERHGGFGAIQGVLERKNFGVGLGFASIASPGGSDRALQPSASARVGSLDGISIRADYRAPEAAMGLVGGPRIGVGWNQGRSRKARLLVGVATTPVPDSARRMGGFLDLAVPLGLFKSKGGLSFSAFIGGVHHGYADKRIRGFGFGAWVQP